MTDGAAITNLTEDKLRDRIAGALALADAA